MQPLIRVVLLVLLAAVTPLWADAKPNVVVILADDLGFSDLGCYGSEIETPNLDRLAAQGLRFSHFYNTAKCHSSRISLLSGRWCEQAGNKSLANAVIIPEVLRPAGYFTAMAGKWHLSKEPTDFGFDRYFGHLSGATNYYKGNNSFRLNGQPWAVPAKDFYTTVANVDFAIKFLNDARQTKKPWFLYLAFNAPHAPLQPLRQDYEKYLGRYTTGWDNVHQQRSEKLQKLGLLPASAQAAPRPDNIPAWTNLSPAIREWEQKRMAAYAALIDRLDREIGRLLTNLEQAGELDNTLIVFLSDNGACPYDRSNQGQDLPPYNPKSSWSDSTGWAWARNAPYRYYKQNQFEGGIATPAIIHWPAGLKTKPGSIDATPAHLVDLLPTIAELAGAKIPATFPGRKPSPLAGISLAPIFAGEKIAQRPPLHFLFAADRGLRVGDWKIVSFASGPWELYNLIEDPTELHDLAAAQPERVKTMAATWHRMAQEDLELARRNQQPVSTTPKPKIHREWSDYSGKNGANTSSRRNKSDSSDPD